MRCHIFRICERTIFQTFWHYKHIFIVISDFIRSDYANRITRLGSYLFFGAAWLQFILKVMTARLLFHGVVCHFFCRQDYHFYFSPFQNLNLFFCVIVKEYTLNIYIYIYCHVCQKLKMVEQILFVLVMFCMSKLTVCGVIVECFLLGKIHYIYL